MSATGGLEAAAHCLPAAVSHTTLLHEPIILSQQQVLLNLSHGVERNTHHDQERRSAELEGHVDQMSDELRQQCDERQEDCTGQSDPGTT